MNRYHEATDTPGNPHAKVVMTLLELGQVFAHNERRNSVPLGPEQGFLQ